MRIVLLAISIVATVTTIVSFAMCSRYQTTEEVMMATEATVAVNSSGTIYYC